MGLIATPIGRELQAIQEILPATCISVLDFGADPTGVADSTAAFAAASAAAGQGGAICVPVGTYLVDPDQGFWEGRLWIGERAHATDVSIVRARVAGTNLILAQTPIQISNISLGGANLVSTTLNLDGADDSVLFAMSAGGATGSAIRVANTMTLTGFDVQGSASAIGFEFVEAKARMYQLVAGSNTTRGLQITGTGDDTDESFVGIYGALMEVNTGPEQLRVTGARAGALVGLFSEGPGDHLVVDGDTRNFLFSSLRFTGGGAPTVAVRLLDARQCSFVQIGATGAPTDAFGRIRVEGPSEANQFYSCNFGSGVSTQSMRIDFFDGITSYEAFANCGLTFFGPSAPTVGNWLQGQMVFNDLPTAGSTLAWRCVASGSPGTWEALPP